MLKCTFFFQIVVIRVADDGSCEMKLVAHTALCDIVLGWTVYCGCS
jgi:hypothetical protein